MIRSVVTPAAANAVTGSAVGPPTGVQALPTPRCSACCTRATKSFAGPRLIAKPALSDVIVRSLLHRSILQLEIKIAFPLRHDDRVCGGSRPLHLQPLAVDHVAKCGEH